MYIIWNAPFYKTVCTMTSGRLKILSNREWFEWPRTIFEVLILVFKDQVKLYKKDNNDCNIIYIQPNLISLKL